MSHATFFPRSVLASVVLALAALLAAVSPGDTTPNAPVNPAANTARRRARA